MPRFPLREKTVEIALLITSFSCLFILFSINVFLFKEGIPVFHHTSIVDFLFGKYWYPTHEPPEFGIFPLIVASFSVTFVSSFIAIPIALFTAILFAEYIPSWLRNILKPVLELIAAIPSVVVGFFGMVTVAPFLQDMFDLATGLNLFNAALMLAFMAIPLICSISEDAIFGVPMELREASYALGATRIETVLRVVIPAALPGISTAIILGMSRSIGETMVVLMVAGGAAMIPRSIFDPVRPMPASIAAEMAEAPVNSSHYHALFATGMVLFIITLLFNVLAYYISKKYKQVGAATL